MFMKPARGTQTYAIIKRRGTDNLGARDIIDQHSWPSDY